MIISRTHSGGDEGAPPPGTSRIEQELFTVLSMILGPGKSGSSSVG
ncbi:MULTISPECIES: hypothetical protein [Actinosynnema]|nr:hypothetical protein [Actinosynnema pretiosum]